jgi:hypothetical protein
MTIAIFVGPTLRREEVAAAIDVVCLPPAAQGDVYRAALQRPRAVGVIDGYFSGAPSIWHKEILWAMSQGIHVFGSASMGALRAAELHSFGMRGVGRIFEAYIDGTLEDDDEVAVVHGPAEIGYLPLSEPMVNIRATLARAEAEGVVSRAAGRALTDFGKSLFFPERNWSALLERAVALGVSEAEIVSLRSWLPNGSVDQKRIDALDMLSAMQETLASGQPFKPDFRFEWTHLWDEFVFASVGQAPDPSAPVKAILEELRIEGPDSYERAETRALLRAAAAVGAGRAPAVSADDLRAALREIRAELGLYLRADLDHWLSQNDLDETSLERLLHDEVCLKTLRDRIGRSLEPFLVDELRRSGDYPRLAERARAKKAALDNKRGADAASSATLASAAARLWYFESRLTRPMPDDVLEFARRLGFADVAAFDAAIGREWAYSQFSQHNICS